LNIGGGTEQTCAVGVASVDSVALAAEGDQDDVQTAPRAARASLNISGCRLKSRILISIMKTWWFAAFF
jgi:hypothetical protein